jgi:uncharacterized membrane-anchored protein
MLAETCTNGWPTALVVIAVVIAAAACYIAYRLTGGDSQSGFWTSRANRRPDPEEPA